jgi:copper homeostasis protein (lipoprotein)
MRERRTARRMWKRGWILALLVGACGAASGPDEPFLPAPPVTKLAPGDSLFAISRPAAFAGVLPCADCERIEATFILHPNGSYRAQERYRGEREPNTFVEVGRWSVRRVEGDSLPRLTLHRNEGPQHFAMKSELRVRLLDAEGGAIDSRLPSELIRISAPGTLDGLLRVRGEFRYFADAATLVSCNGGVQFPVSGDSAYIRLQGAHGRAMLGTAAATFVNLRARLEVRPGMEAGTLLETVVVDSVVSVEPTGACGATRVRSEIAVGDWVMTALDGTPLPTLTAAQTPSLRFVLSEPTMFGNAGCNRFTGRPVLRGLDLVAEPVAMTKMMCADEGVMALEQRYSTILGEGGWFGLDGTALVLSRGGTERARFTRR